MDDSSWLIEDIVHEVLLIFYDRIIDFHDIRVRIDDLTDMCDNLIDRDKSFFDIFFCLSTWADSSMSKVFLKFQEEKRVSNINLLCRVYVYFSIFHIQFINSNSILIILFLWCRDSLYKDHHINEFLQESGYDWSLEYIYTVEVHRVLYVRVFSDI